MGHRPICFSPGMTSVARDCSQPWPCLPWGIPSGFISNHSYMLFISMLYLHFSFLFLFFFTVPEGRKEDAERKLKGTAGSYGEGNDNPLQCSCLENPRDGGAWWAAVYGVAQSQTQLKQLSSSSSRKLSLLYNQGLTLINCK